MDPDRLHDVVARLRHWCAFIGPRRLVSGATSIVAFAVVMWFIFRPSAMPVEEMMPIATVPPVSTSVAPTHVTVHVAGAVTAPGVYSLVAGARVVDALDAAGGPTREADLVRINLAQVLHDTEQVFIPARQPSRTPALTVAPRHQPTTTIASATAGGGDAASGPVNLNVATEAELDALPGIGPSTAKAIIGHRRDKGPFARIEDLLNVPGIGPAKLAALEGLVSVG